MHHILLVTAVCIKANSKELVAITGFSFDYQVNIKEMFWFIVITSIVILSSKAEPRCLLVSLGPREKISGLARETPF